VGARAIRCTQAPGDVLYIPEGWFHGTLNEGHTLALALQARIPRSAVGRARYLARGVASQQNAKKVLKLLRDAFPVDEELALSMAMVQVDLAATVESQLYEASDLHSGESQGAALDPLVVRRARKHYERAARAAREANTLDSADPRKQLLLCKVLLQQFLFLANTQQSTESTLEQEGRAALDACTRASQLDTYTTEPHFTAGLCAVKMAEFSTAIAHFRDALAIDPNASSVLYHLANTLVNLEPHVGYFRLEFGALLAKQGNVGDARAQLKQAVRLDSRLGPEATELVQKLSG